MVVVVVHATTQHRVVDGRRRPVRALCRRTVDVLLPLTAQDLPEGGAHLLIAIGVDDGVHGRVELGEEQEELLVGEDVAAGTEDVEEEDDQAWCPADDEGTWRGGRTTSSQKGGDQPHQRTAAETSSTLWFCYCDCRVRTTHAVIQTTLCFG